MAQEIINIGNVANDGNGDPLRLAFEKINNNFTQLYSIAGGAGAAAGVDGSIQFRATNDLLSVAYSGGTWVAFGSPDKFYVSYDGVIWTNTPAPVSEQIRAVYATPAGFIAVGDNGTIITSNDLGVTWSVETSGTTANLLAVHFNSVTNLYLTVGTGGKILSSADGSNWNTNVSGVTITLNAIAYNPTGIGYVVVGAAGTALLSLTGSTWITQTTGATANLTGITFDGGSYIATGAGGIILTSVNGVNWFARTSGTTQNLSAVTVGNIANVATLITVGANGTTLSSVDGAGATWSPITTGTTNGLSNISFGNGTFYTVGTNGIILETGNVANGWSNVSIPGTLDGSANFTYDPLTETLSVPNLNVANLQANLYSANTVVANQIVALNYANLGDVGNIYIGGGNANSVLSTDGNGQLTWVPGLEPGAPNLSVQFNVAGEFTGDANFTYSPSTQTLTSTNSNIGNAQVSNLEITTLATIPTPANLRIGGGSNGYVLLTDGTGNLEWSPNPASNIVALPPVYFVSSPSPGTGQQFTDPILDNYVSNSDITLFVNGQLLEFQNYTLAGNTITIDTFLPPNANVDIIRQFVAEANITGLYGNANVAAFLPTYTGTLAPSAIFTNGYFYANGVPFNPGGNYSNANVANYLPTYTGNLSNVNSIATTGNITAGTGAFFIGDGGLLSNISGTGTYSNANVANYLPTYGGNIAANNITVTGNLSGNVNGLVNGIDIRYLVFDFAYLQPNTYNNPIQYLLAKTGDVAFGTFTVPTPLNIDFGTF
jgi:hypothetical protein